MSDEWIEIKLGEYVDLNPEGIKKDYPYLEINYIDISSVGTGTLQGTTKYELNKAPSRAKRIVRNNDIILSTVRPNRRSFYYIKNAYNNLIASTGFVVLRNKKGLNSLFLYYLINQQDFTDYLTNSAKGSAYPAVDNEIISKAILKIPKSLETQKKIATILSNYDDLIENNNKRIEILEKQAKLIYEEWFVKFKFPTDEKIEFIGSELGRIPKGWEVDSIGNKFKVILGGTPSRVKEEFWNGNIPWINSGKVNQLRIIDESELITELGLNKSATKMMPIRSTVLAITGATLGQISLLEIKACANQSVVGIFDENKKFSEYIYLKINEVIKDMVGKAGGGAQQHINKDIICQTNILLPNEIIINNFNKKIIPIFNEISNLLFKNQNLRKTRDLLLPKLISGQIDTKYLSIK